VTLLLCAAMAVFTQLSLPDAISRAVSNSAAVASAVATVREREAQLSLARGTAVPHLSGDYSLAPQAGPLDVNTVEQHFITVGAGISLSDLISSPSAVHAAAGDLLAAQRSASAAELAAKENAVKLYFSALQAVAIERIREDALQGALRDRAAAGIRSRNGESPQLDVLRADVSLSQARADLARAQADRGDAVEALASATAVDSQTLATLSEAPFPRSKSLGEPQAVTRALAMRPELSSLVASLQARNAELGGARRSGIATATIEGGYQTGVDTGIPVHGAAVAAHLEVPLASGSHARVAAAQAQVDATYAQLVEERRTIALEVASAVRDARALDAASQAAQQATQEASQALDAIEIGYREGASSSLDVEVARRTYEETRVQALVAAYDSARSQAVLEIVIP
jgi:cobalt-zinc-cadmium efflux system outer membrane protein